MSKEAEKHETNRRMMQDALDHKDWPRFLLVADRIWKKTRTDYVLSCSDDAPGYIRKACEDFRDRCAPNKMDQVEMFTEEAKGAA